MPRPPAHGPTRYTASSSTPSTTVDSHTSMSPSDVPTQAEAAEPFEERAHRQHHMQSASFTCRKTSTLSPSSHTDQQPAPDQPARDHPAHDQPEHHRLHRR
jgi:hypothetical protein